MKDIQIHNWRRTESLYWSCFRDLSLWYSRCLLNKTYACNWVPLSFLPSSVNAWNITKKQKPQRSNEPWVGSCVWVDWATAACYHSARSGWLEADRRISPWTHSPCSSVGATCNGPREKGSAGSYNNKWSSSTIPVTGQLNSTHSNV